MRSRIFLLAALPFLSGCLTPLDTPAKRTVAPTLAETPVQPAETLSQEKTAPVLRAAELTYPDVEALKGEASDKVTRLLGAPDFRRTDKPAELWQYRHDKCSFDLFLYPRDGGGLSIKFMDVRAYGDQNLSLQACFLAILKAKADLDNRG